MPYSAQAHTRRVDRDALRALVPGWVADLDLADRPSGVKERTDVDSGAHWELPDRQEESAPRERSIEHTELPPVFGTAAPLTGLSGAVRSLAYSRYSEARAAHWLLLVLGDRIDVIESRAVSLARGRPDDPVTQTGVLSERSRHGLRSRVARRRGDLGHTWLDPLIVAAPWILGALAASSASGLSPHGANDART